MKSVLYRNSDNIFRTSVLNESTGEVFPVSSIANVVYTISDEAHGTALITKTLGDGIEKINGDDELETTLDDTEMTFDGEYFHMMQITDNQGNKLPPVFADFVTIK